MSSGLLAGIGLTRLRVYDQRPAPDGTMSGCAHVHAYTDEAYYVIAGAGAVELHDPEHGFRRVPLHAGDFVQFGPGTLHRSVSEGGLEVLALMGNAGLAERGDARIYFGPEVDADPDRFERLRALPRSEGLEGALRRRDASALAYAALMDLWHTDRAAYTAELKRFVDRHRADVAQRRSQYAAVVEEGPGQWLHRTRERLRGLEPETPRAGGSRLEGTAETLGMCGLLRQLPEPTPL